MRTSLLISLLSIWVLHIYAQPASWGYTITGSNHTIIIPTTANLNISGQSLSDGDYIGVFYLDNQGHEVCGGYTQWSGSNTALSAFGDDTGGTAKNGFANNESFRFKVATASGCIIDSVSASFASGGFYTHTGNYSDDGISGFQAFDATITDPACCGRDVFEPNDAMQDAALLPTIGIHKNAQICLPDDEDWYVFNINPTSPHLHVALRGLPADYSLELYNSSGMLLSSSTNPSLQDEQISQNSLSAGDYYIRVSGSNDNWDNHNGYILLAQTRSVPFGSVKSHIDRGRILSVRCTDMWGRVVYEGSGDWKSVVGRGGYVVEEIGVGGVVLNKNLALK